MLVKLMFRFTTKVKSSPTVSRRTLSPSFRSACSAGPSACSRFRYWVSVRPAGSFSAAAASRGKGVFEGKARCASCHVPPLFVEPGWPMHTGAEIGIDDFQASRSPDKRFYRTTPLAGLFTRAKGGFYHDGRFADLAAVVAHYDGHLKLQLSESEKADLVEYLKSL